MDRSVVNNTNSKFNNSNDYIMLTAFEVPKLDDKNIAYSLETNDTEIVTVIMNPSDVSLTFTLIDERDEYNGMGVFNVSLLAHSIFTLVY